MTINRHGGAVEVIKKESMIGAKHIVSVKSEERLYALIFDDEASPHGVIFLCYFVFNLIVTCMTLTKPTSLKLTYKTHLRRGLHFNLLPAPKCSAFAFCDSLDSTTVFPHVHNTGWGLATSSFYCTVWFSSIVAIIITPFYKSEQCLHLPIHDPFHIAEVDVWLTFPCNDGKTTRRLAHRSTKVNATFSRTHQTKACENSLIRFRCNRLQNCSIVGFLSECKMTGSS